MVFNIEAAEPLTDEEFEVLRWLLAETFEPDNLDHASFLGLKNNITEVGPRMNFATAWNTNALSILCACGIKKVTRIERSRRYKNTSEATYDRMTECPYPKPLETFETGIIPEAVYEIPLMEEGPDALRKINKKLGLGMDDWDTEYYFNFFVNILKRNPTNVECFQLGQSNSEHSRHWFFKGKLIIDGKEVLETLMDIIGRPLRANPRNSVIAFRDNSSSIRGFKVRTIIPEHPRKTSHFKETSVSYDIIFTAETHNFPSGVAPFPGAETGTGGRIRDIQAMGRGGLVIAGTAGYCVANLLIPDYELPWETESTYPGNLASPIQIEIEASNGASDYGNKFGEPVIQGFTRSVDMRLPNGERTAYVKPIMFTGGVGQMDARHAEKIESKKGMLIVHIGGLAYRIGVGGGAASSMVQGENIAELDFKAVQRGDAEMEQKMNRVIRACVEMGEENPIESIHDQGAGGPCNVVTELTYPAGGRVDIRKITVGDSTLSVLEIWGAEFQECNGLTIKRDRIEEFGKICNREKVEYRIVGEITGDGKIVLHDSNDDSTPADLEQEKILGKMPQKIYRDYRNKPEQKALEFPKKLTVRAALERVLRLVSVGSKRFLSNKVDRSVTGLIAQQQCCGPLQLTVSDVAVIAQSHFGLTGAAISVGEQPIKMLIDPKAGARMSVAEAITNIVWAKVSALEDIKCSANWMWAAKYLGERARIYDAAVAASELMTELGIAIDGGKDSMSMAAMVGEEVVKSPGTLVISAYSTMDDITKAITPDIKKPGESRLIYIDLARGKRRLGGSALAQVYGQIGDECPDVEDPELFKRAFKAIQEMIDKDLILAGHDVSDGGLIVTLLEMAFAGNCGLEAGIPPSKIDEEDENSAAIPALFAEEAGLVIEYLPKDEVEIVSIAVENNIGVQRIGETLSRSSATRVIIGGYPFGGTRVLDEDMRELRQLWEETSYQLERLQANPECADKEKKNIFDRPGPRYRLSFAPEPTSEKWLNAKDKPKVAIIREEGSNGDREMTSAFYQAGFECWDVIMTDLLKGDITLDQFRGIAFVGGFSYADVLDSAKGWAGVIRFNENLRKQFDKFHERSDTFSLGVCNGCQLMALLGLVPWQGIDGKSQPRFIRNKSGRFESRFPAIKILPSPSIMFQGMEGSVLGVNLAHGEGRAYFPDESILEVVRERCLAPVRYVDDNNQITEKYPFNPNGSIQSIAALCSPDGRHLAIMPHPERTFINWQWHWMPEEMKKSLKVSPWLKIFQNAREWCEETK